MNTRIATAIGAAVLVVGAGFVGWWFGSRATASAATPAETHAHAAAHRVPGYVCPMHPQVTASAPGACPICGMQLVPIPATAPNDSPQSVRLSPAMTQNLGIRTQRVQYGAVITEVYAAGTIDRMIPPRDYTLTTHAAGRIHAMRIRTGEWIGEGTLIAELEVPGYAQAQRAYLAARATQNQDEAMQTRERLTALGATDALFTALDEGRAPVNFVQVLAPHAGRVRAVRAKAGVQVARGAALATVEAPVMAHVGLISHALTAYQVKSGNAVRVRLLQRPDKDWPGRVESVALRVAGIPFLSFGVSFAGPRDATENNLFVYGYVETARRARALRVPAEAVIRLESENRVVRARGDGSFEPVRIETGLANAEWVEVTAGLAEGDEIVTSGQFLLDAEANLRAGLARLAPAPTSVP